VITFIIRRLIGTVFLLIVVSMITFAIFFIIPRLAGQTTYQLATQYVGRNPTRQAILQIERQLGLADPLYLQYGRFLKGIFFGTHYNSGTSTTYCPPPCFGYSFRSQQPVWPQMVSDIPVTLSLAIGASVLWLVGGVSIGVLSALRRGSLFDRFSMGIALAGVSLPIFFTGLIALELFSYKWPIFPNVTYVSFTTNPLLWARNLVLPWIVLAFLYAALYARLTRAGMLETMSEDYIRTARAKGLPERTVIVKHGLRAALTPIVTIFGMDLGLLLGGAIITEVTFSLKGLGLFTVEAIQNQDLPEILGVTMLAAFFIVIANLVVDIFYAVLVGESGSGKSVTSLGIMGLHQGTEAQITGHIRLDGEELVGARATRIRELRGNEMAMIFQDPLSSLHPYYSVGNQIVEAYRIHNPEATKQQARQRAVDMLARVGIPEPKVRVDDYPHQFSGGMRQRVMIAMALVNDPELLIADEPTTALDVTVQAQILDLISDLQAEFGSAVIMITHDLGVVAELSDDILVMYAGRVAEYGSAADIFARPGHPYTWGLLASMPRMDRERLTRLVPIPGTPPSLIRVPPGCPFHPRCRYGHLNGGRSETEVPELRATEETGHLVACHLTAAERTRQWALLSAGQVPDDVKETVPQGGVEA
jgi:peptide/nickel transport system permease protein